MSETFYRPPSVRGPRPARTLPLRSGAIALGVVFGGGLLVAGAVLVLRHHPAFRVGRVVPYGVPTERLEAVEKLTDPLLGQPLLFVDVDAVVRRLSAEPWVARASARRVIPDALVVQVAVRPSVALARRGDELWTVDSAGTWLGPYAAGVAGGDAALIDAGDPAAPDAPERRARGAAFVERLRLDDPALFSRLSEVVVLDDAFAVHERTSDVRLLFGLDALDERRAARLWRAYLALVPEIERHLLHHAEADLRFKDRIVLTRPAAPADRGST